jgi:hypothetical protein
MTLDTPRLLIAFSLLGSSLMCAADPGAEIAMRVSVPKEVSAQATARARGDAAAPAPVLVLEGVELGRGEGLTFDVLGPADHKSGTRLVLAVTGLVGEPQKVLVEPRQVMTLVVPLNDRALPLMAGKTEIALTIRVEDPGRPRLKFKRAFFRVYDKSGAK